MTWKRLLPSPTLLGENLYHYTTQAGLLGIARDRALWMTDIRHLNDSTEFDYAIGLVRGRIDIKLREEKDLNRRAFLSSLSDQLIRFEAYTRYVVCFSKNGDSLSQWRAYTDNGVGFAVAVKDRVLKSMADDQFHHLIKCVYDSDEQNEIINRLFSVIESKFEPNWISPRNNEQSYDDGRSGRTLWRRPLYRRRRRCAICWRSRFHLQARRLF